MLRLVWLTIVALLIAPAPADALPVVNAIGAIASALSASLIGRVVLQTVVLGALTMLSRSLSGGRSRRRQARSTVAFTGSLTPELIPVGRTATRGSYSHPPYVTGSLAVVPVTLSALPGATLRRIAVNGEWVDLDFANPVPNYGYPAVSGSKYAGWLWVKYYDGSQTAADDWMVAKFGSDSVAPWTADMVGSGYCYALVIARKGSDPELWTGLPQPIFELDGVPLYDPRQDDTAGGTGPQRWDDPSTWAQTDNPIVIVYNILRGISLPGGDIWGGRATADDLPYDVWAAAMDVCDETVNGSPRYRAGLTLQVDREPAQEIEELLRAANASIAVQPDGRILVWAGGPGLPVTHVDDDVDVVINREETASPLLPTSDRYTGVAVSYSEPVKLWALEQVNEVSVVDSGGLWSRRIADYQLDAVWDAGQAQRIAASVLADNLLTWQHELTLPPSHSFIEAGDVVTVTSLRFGYTSKSFQVIMSAEEAATGAVQLRLREVDHGGWA